MFSFPLVVCLAGVCCLGPLALYFLWLSVLTRRDRPTVVSGGWDFAALLAGLSGFVLFGGGLFLAVIQSNARFVLRGNVEALRDAWGQEQVAWVLTVALYLMVVVGAVVFALPGRRRTLVVYNVDPGQFEVTLTELFDHLGRPVERRGNLWVGGSPLFELEPFAAGKTVTLRWVSDDQHLFQEVERQVREAMLTLPAGENPAARWFASAVASCVIVAAFCVAMLLFSLRRAW